MYLSVGLRQHIYEEEEVLTGQQLCNQERLQSGTEEPEPPQIKEEQESTAVGGLCLKQGGRNPLSVTPTNGKVSTVKQEPTVTAAPLSYLL
ncbi:zinc finger protein 91-like isoform X1 [Lates japonicus]|uniref:Zinc finger protein 91-like isoform X1 n=1 Tax=Lates japonicus TaxID=270547 RepID=A0AAD3MBD8_LATJO|nr:zinc finger protein 91-like isoform X1 [Lates japonicus]